MWAMLSTGQLSYCCFGFRLFLLKVGYARCGIRLFVAMWVTLGVVVNCWYKISQWFGILLKVGYLEKTFDLGYAAI